VDLIEQIRAAERVAPVGARTQWEVGGPAPVDAIEVRAPEGTIAYEPGDMTITVGAGTPFRALDAALAEHGAQLVTLAGYMRLVPSDVTASYRGRMLNVHPSLLPAYPGLNTHARAIADGARIHGCTVHFVTPAVDVGPIVAQAAVPVRDDDDAASLAARVLAAEHVLLPRVVQWYCQGRIVVDGNRVSVRTDSPPAEGVLFSPAP